MKRLRRTVYRWPLLVGLVAIVASSAVELLDASPLVLTIVRSLAVLFAIGVFVLVWIPQCKDERDRKVAALKRGR